MSRQPLESTRFVNPRTSPRPPGYSNVVEVSNSRIIFIAGQTATDPEGKLVGKGVEVCLTLRHALAERGQREDPLGEWYVVPDDRLVASAATR